MAIQLGDVRGDDVVTTENLHRYELKDLPHRFLVRGGEVIFKSRGAPNTAATVCASLEEPAAVLLPLIIIRPDPTIVHPEYLAWAINLPEAQRRLDTEARGTVLRMIPMAALKQLEIPLPDLDTQSRIATIHALARHESSLLRELADCRERLTRLVLSEQAKLANCKGLER